MGSPALQQRRTHAELEQTSLTHHMQATQDMYLCKYSPESGLELAQKVEQGGVSTQPDRNHPNNISLSPQTVWTFNSFYKADAT